MILLESILFSCFLTSTLAIAAPFILFGNAAYTHSLVVNFQIGTPAKMYPVTIDTNHINVLLPPTCAGSFISSNKKRSVVEFNSSITDNNIRKSKRSDQGTCSVPLLATGFDYTKSSSAMVAPGLFQDSDFIPAITSSSNKLKSRSFYTPSAFPVLRIVDKIWISAAVYFLMPFNVYVHSMDARFAPGDMFETPPVPPGTPIPGTFGIMGHPFYYNPATVTSTSTSTTTIQPPPTPPPVPPVPLWQDNAMADLLGNPDFAEFEDELLIFQQQQQQLAIGINYGPINPSGLNKRSTTCSQVKFRGIDYSMLSGTIYWFKVFGDVKTRFIWRMSLRSVQVGAGTVSTPASFKVNGQTNMLNSMDTIQVDTTGTFIWLRADRVTSIYNQIGTSNVRPPSTTNMYWTYKCRAIPSVSLEIVDIYGNAQLMTLDQRDFFHGLSPDAPGWCIGAIQALSTTSAQQLLGLNFMASFYTILLYNTNLAAFRVGFAINNRKC